MAADGSPGQRVPGCRYDSAGKVASTAAQGRAAVDEGAVVRRRTSMYI